MSPGSEEDLCCPVCRDVFRDPVVLSCSHSFCRACVQSWWTEKPTRECPFCKRRSSRSDPPRNLALRNLCEALVLQRDRGACAGPGLLCSTHSEELKLFCEDHRQPVCVVCLHSHKHSEHKFRPADEAAKTHRDELRGSLKPLKKKLKLLVQVKANCEETAEHVRVQARRTERRIQDEFKKLHRFLREEEEARIAALREEEERKSRRMREETEALSREIAALSDTIGAAEEELRAEDVSFLLGYKATAERVQRPLLEDPQLPSGALIDEAKHVGNLSFGVWDRMKEAVSYTPVVLDPNTAAPGLALSEDLTAVRWREGPRLPANPERVEHCGVLGSEGVRSGARGWDVEVEDGADWSVGAVEAAAGAAGSFRAWVLWLRGDGATALSPAGPDAELPVRAELRRVRVHLDWGGGRLSFSDPGTGTHIHTFTHAFTEAMFPYVETWSPARILPVKVSVALDRHHHREDGGGGEGGDVMQE